MTTREQDKMKRWAVHNVKECKVEVEKRPDGWWMWRCSVHGEGAFYHKTQADALAEAKWSHRNKEGETE